MSAQNKYTFVPKLLVLAWLKIGQVQINDLHRFSQIYLDKTFPQKREKTVSLSQFDVKFFSSKILLPISRDLAIRIQSPFS